MKSVLFMIVALATSNAMAGSLCASNEKPLFECKHESRSYALCASNDLSLTSGSLQYRASEGGKINFAYPDKLENSKSNFVARMTGDGVEVDFANKDYLYSISTDARDNDAILVMKNDKIIAHIACRDENTNQTDLSMTSTINLLMNSGIMK